MTWRIGFTLTAGFGVVPGVEKSVLVADTELGLNDADEDGVFDRILVRKTGRGLEVVTLVSRVLCFLIVSVSAAAKLSAVVCLDTGDSLDHVAASDDAELDTESELGDLDLDVRAAGVGLGAGMGGLLARGPVGRSITRSGVL